MATRADSARTDGQLGVTEFWAAQGHGSPMMIHSREDEGYLVLDGELTFWINDDRPFVHGPGGFAWMPRGTPHAYAVSSPTARFLCINTPGGLESFFGAVGAPAEGDALPVAGSPTSDEIERVEGAARGMGITITGPPPGL
ncbi:cupin domain-containing protein [Actinomycetospora sp.]|uniref:cupin domain-containing protein n=1 Tax=Actinomycetospora sp. TaxID=1872135 RepID=UPI002F3F2DD5